MKNLYLIIAIVGLLACTRELTPYELEIREYRDNILVEFLEDDRAPLEKEDFKFLTFFVADSSFRVNASYTLLPEERAFDIKTSSGNFKSYRKYAQLSFRLNQQDYKLYVYESMKHREMEEYKNYLFLPFTDLTNGESTYGGGRYLDLEKDKMKNGELLLDFNKAYNPWCAYSDGYNCPIPPQDNDLEIAITAGERMYTGEYKQRNPE